MARRAAYADSKLPASPVLQRNRARCGRPGPYGIPIDKRAKMVYDGAMGRFEEHTWRLAKCPRSHAPEQAQSPPRPGSRLAKRDVCLGGAGEWMPPMYRTPLVLAGCANSALPASPVLQQNRAECRAIHLRRAIGVQAT